MRTYNVRTSFGSSRGSPCVAVIRLLRAGAGCCCPGSLCEFTARRAAFLHHLTSNTARYDAADTRVVPYQRHVCRAAASRDNVNQGPTADYTVVQTTGPTRPDPTRRQVK